MFNKWFSKKGSASSVEEQDTLSVVAKLIREVMGDQLPEGAHLGSETRLDAIGFDSINYINLVLSLEDVLDVDMETIVKDLDIGSFQTIGDISKFVEEFPNR